MRTPPDILAMLRAGGIIPTYWRRKRANAKWHRGFRQGSLMVRSQCDKIAGADGGRLLFAPIEEPWPEPRCRTCEGATPGTDAVREATDVGSVRGRRVRRGLEPMRTTDAPHTRRNP